MSDLLHDRMYFEPLETGAMKAFGQSEYIRDMIVRNEELVRSRFARLTRRQRNWFTGTRHVRDAALSNVLNASLVTLDDKPVGVMANARVAAGRKKDVYQFPHEGVGMAVSYWLDEEKLDQQKEFSAPELHRWIAHLAIGSALIQHEDAYAWTTLGPDIATDPSRGFDDMMLSGGSVANYEFNMPAEAAPFFATDGMYYSTSR